MSRSTCISLLCLSVAIWNFVQHRDISANMFVAALFIIQGCKPAVEESDARAWGHVKLLCIILSAAIFLFSVRGYFSDLQWNYPKSW